MSALRIFPPTDIDPQGTVINRAELNQLPVCFVRPRFGAWNQSIPIFAGKVAS